MSAVLAAPKKRASPKRSPQALKRREEELHKMLAMYDDYELETCLAGASADDSTAPTGNADDSDTIQTDDLVKSKASAIVEPPSAKMVVGGRVEPPAALPPDGKKRRATHDGVVRQGKSPAVSNASRKRKAPASEPKGAKAARVQRKGVQWAPGVTSPRLTREALHKQSRSLNEARSSAASLPARRKAVAARR